MLQEPRRRRLRAFEYQQASVPRLRGYNGLVANRLIWCLPFPPDLAHVASCRPFFGHHGPSCGKQDFAEAVKGQFSVFLGVK